MRCTYVNAPGRDIAAGLHITTDGVVQRVDAARFPQLAAVRPGMRLLSINGATVKGAEAQNEQRRYQSFEGEILIVLSPREVKDELDISSDDDESSSNFKPNTFMPAFGHGKKSSPGVVVFEAAKRCGPGKCVILMSEGTNPALSIAQAAEKAGVNVVYIDTVGRMKTRQKIDDAGAVFKKSLEKGAWIYLERATKSITLLHKLAECIALVEASGKMHKQSRVFLMCEPHPHFPEALIKDSITLRCRLGGGGGADVEVDQTEDLLESQRRMNVIHGNDPAAATASPEVQTSQRRRVRISGEVDVVHLEKNTFLELSASAKPHVDAGEGATGLVRLAKYNFGSGEKFISLCKVKEGRYAVGTSSGYVVLLDSDGLPLIQFRPHRACVWDVAFSTTYDFSTACEDGTSTIFNYSLAGREVTATSVASFHADVFAVTYADPSDPTSPVLSGGLSKTICVLHSDRKNSTFMPSASSIQAMCHTRNRRVLVGGGDGTCMLLDPVRCEVLDSAREHTRKLPAVASEGDVAVTGGFDRIVRLWDIRSDRFQCVAEKQISEVVTAVATNGSHVAVCSGSDLMVYDVRKMKSPLAIKTGAWKDLTRGLVMDGSMIITASVDGEHSSNNNKEEEKIKKKKKRKKDKAQRPSNVLCRGVHAYTTCYTEEYSTHIYFTFFFLLPLIYIYIYIYIYMAFSSFIYNLSLSFIHSKEEKEKVLLKLDITATL
eukprot:gene10977-7622_t